MRRKLGSSATSSAKNSQTSTDGFTIYDVPTASLDARSEAYTLLKHPDPEVQSGAQRIIDLMTRSIRAMGREDMSVLQVVEGSGDLQLDAKPAA